MANLLFDNKTFIIPGSYGRTKVVNQAGAIPPAFNIALLVAAGDKGQPYDYTTVSPLHLHEYQHEVNDEYGPDSEMATAFKYFKKHGGLKCYCLNASNATKGTAILQGSGPVTVIELTAANWGDYSADIGLTVVNGGSSAVITITDPDDSGIRKVSPALTTLDACVAWINDNASEYLTAVKYTGATLLPATMAGPKLSNAPSYVAGTNPAPISDDFDNIITALPNWITEYDIRLICPVINLISATQHSVIQSFRDLAISQRTVGKFIQVLVGGNLGDYVDGAGDTTAPEFRAGVYNSQDVLLASPGLDSLAPYISSAPAVMGLINGHGLAHNLTRDTIIASTLEYKYSKAELETLIDGGVLAITFNKNGFLIAKGVNTLQANSSTWNASTKTTYLPMQRTIADYILKYFNDDLDETFIGADGVTKNQIAARCSVNWKTLQLSFDPPLFGENSNNVFGTGLPFNTDSIVHVPEGWLVNISFLPAEETNYIGLTVQVMVGYS